MAISWLYTVLFFLIALGVCCALVNPVKKLAFKLDAVDEPSDRRVHKQTTARMGGVAIFAGIFTCVVIAALGTKFLDWRIPLHYTNPSGVNYIVAGLGAVFIFFTGIADDIKCLPPKTKFLLQIIGACITTSSGLLFNNIYNPFTQQFIDFGWIAYPLSVFYLVAFTNIINLIDGLDGLAAGISAISALTIFIFAVTQSKADAAILSIAIFGACIGFLFFNFHPAKIFMGDSGSLTLGFLLGVDSLLACSRTAVVVSMLVPLLAAGVPIIDTLTAIIRRKRDHKPIDQADTGHIHHRLLRSGLSHRATVVVMWAWTAFLSLCGIGMTIYSNTWIDAVIFAVALGVTLIFVIKLHLLEPVLKHHYNHRKKEGRTARETLYGMYNVREGDSFKNAKAKNTNKLKSDINLADARKKRD